MVRYRKRRRILRRRRTPRSRFNRRFRRSRLSRTRRITSTMIPWKSTVVVPVMTQSAGAGMAFPGAFKLGINFNGSPYVATTSGSIVVYSEDSLLFPLKGVDFPGATSFYSLFAQCRCAAVKLRYVPSHQNDGSSIVLWKPMHYLYDYDGHELGLAAQTQANMCTHGAFGMKNLERPWKLYKKSLKYRQYTKIPSVDIGDPTHGGQNMAGQWHGVGDAIAVTNTAYGTHLQLVLQDTTQGFFYGNIYITAYMMYKDRMS